MVLIDGWMDGWIDFWNLRLTFLFLLFCAAESVLDDVVVICLCEVFVLRNEDGSLKSEKSRKLKEVE